MTALVPTPRGLLFSSQTWRTRFEAWGWDSFDALWSLDAETVEPANVRRGGWSSVVRFVAPDGSAFYLKRQENHDFREWDRGIRHRPTVVREWRMGIAFRDIGIETAEPICLGTDVTGSSRGLLVTAALDAHCSLTEMLQTGGISGDVRRQLWQTLAEAVP